MKKNEEARAYVEHAEVSIRVIRADGTVEDHGTYTAEVHKPRLPWRVAGWLNRRSKA